MALAIEAVRADWAAEQVKLNLRSVEPPGLEAPSAQATTQELQVSAVERVWSDWSGVDRARATFGEAERTDPAEVVDRMQADRARARGRIHLACTRPTPDQIAEGVALAAQAIMTPGGGRQSPPAPTSPAPQAAFDAAVAATKAIFSLREAPPSGKNKISDEAFFAEVEQRLSHSPDTSADGTVSAVPPTAKKENFCGKLPLWLEERLAEYRAWVGSPDGKRFLAGEAERPASIPRWDQHPTVTTGPYHDWSVKPEPKPGFFAKLSPDKQAVALAHRGEDTPTFADPLERAMFEDGLIRPRGPWDHAPAPKAAPEKAWTGEVVDFGTGYPLARVWRDAHGRRQVTHPDSWRGTFDVEKEQMIATRPEDLARIPTCAGGMWTTGSWGEQVCSICLAPRRNHSSVPAEKNDSPPANTHFGTIPGGQPLGQPKVNAARAWWETIMADVEAMPQGSQLTLSPWQVRRLYDALHAWGYRSGRGS